MKSPRIVSIVAAICFAAVSTLPFAALANTGTDLPEFSTIEQFVLRHFAAKPSYQAGDLLTRSAADEVLKSIQKLGWVPADANSISSAIPSDQEFIARQLRTPRGERFMRQISGYELSYDRIDRLSQLPDGRRQVYDLVRGKDGYKLIEYLTSSSGGKNLGKMLGSSSKGANFNQPTGRIYTVNALIARLRLSYAQSLTNAQ